jgi:alpha-L-rhamnosidase
MTRDTKLWLENRRGATALGIDEKHPRISWIAPAVGTATLEMAWDDGVVETSSASSAALVAWPFRPVRPREGGWLRVSPAGGAPLAPLRVEGGIGAEWSADFVSPSTSAGQDGPRPAFLMRARFALDDIHPDAVARARIYATAHGLYELELNGAAVADDLLAPGWSSYGHRLRYRTYDVTGDLRSGTNVVGAWLADGWYRGHIGFDGGLWDIYGADVSLLLQLEITTTTGARRIVPLTHAWEWTESAILATGLYEGETHDATRHPTGWTDPDLGADPGDVVPWHPAAVLPLAGFPARIEAPTGPPVRETETLRPVSVTAVAGDRIRLDFGQNIAGKVRIRPRAERGRTIRIHHAEVLEGGLLGTRPLRAATSIDTYVTAGTPGEEWTPRFTVHGFRYAELEGWPGGVDAVDVEAVVMHSDMVRTGWFESSHPGLNQLHSNVVWSMRDNFVDIPTDCPQRDERMGWTGDIQVFAPTALYLYSAQGLLSGWLRDLAAEQRADGHVPQFVPWVECGFPNFPTAAWGDAAVVVPWTIYEHDGDTRVLADQYDSMRAWVDLVDRLTGGTGLWNTGFQLGDWLDPAAPPEDPGRSHTDRYLVATAYHVRTSRILAETARILGRTDDAMRYDGIAARATTAFQREYLSASGRVVSDTTTSIALALTFDLFPDAASAARAGARLRELVELSEYRITTGFVGTPIICDALVMAGAVDTAYHLLLQDRLPSWLYPVTMGATTIWERWDSMLPDGSINPGDMTSFNHYALGAVADFLHRSVAGLASAAPGWTRLRIAPLPGGGLASASTTHETPLGTASCAWTRVEGMLRVDVVVPVGATASVELPGTDAREVGAGAHSFAVPFRDPSDDPRPVPPRRRPEPATV